MPAATCLAVRRDVCGERTERRIEHREGGHAGALLWLYGGFRLAEVLHSAGVVGEVRVLDGVDDILRNEPIQGKRGDDDDQQVDKLEPEVAEGDFAKQMNHAANCITPVPTRTI